MKCPHCGAEFEPTPSDAARTLGIRGGRATSAKKASSSAENFRRYWRERKAGRKEPGKS